MAPAPLAPEYVTVQEAATRLGYTVQHTRLLIRRGRIVAVKFGRDWLVSRASVVELERRRANADDREHPQDPDQDA